MTTTKSILNQCEIVGSVFQVRIEKLLLEDGKIVSSGWHRVCFEPGCDVEATIASTNVGLVDLGYSALSEKEWDEIRAIIKEEWTPLVISAHEDAICKQNDRSSLNMFLEKTIEVRIKKFEAVENTEVFEITP